MSHADVKNVKITKSVLSLTKFDQIPAICSGYLCDSGRFFFCKCFIIGGIAQVQIPFKQFRKSKKAVGLWGKIQGQC